LERLIFEWDFEVLEGF